MKYMGHKGRILASIRKRIERFASDASTLCDPFCGSGIVAWDLAEHFHKPVLAADLQSFAAARAAAVISRTSPIVDFTFVDSWFARARDRVAQATRDIAIPETPRINGKLHVADVRRAVLESRQLASDGLAKPLVQSNELWPITLAYGGYYFSIPQALTLDALRATLPDSTCERAVALAALISGASRCSASPGHTAQPLGVKRSSLPHLLEAWNRSVVTFVREEVEHIGGRHARVTGRTLVASWEHTVQQLKEHDVAFCDPPYSSVQYSRFYHVLETLSRGLFVNVSGTGRNPPFNERPESDFSRKSKAKQETEGLIRLAAERNIRLVITFPVSRQSNGLAASTFAIKARKMFRHVDVEEVSSVFSSLGGNGANGARPARKSRTERIICCYN